MFMRNYDIGNIWHLSTFYVKFDYELGKPQHNYLHKLAQSAGAVEYTDCFIAEQLALSAWVAEYTDCFSAED